MRWINPVITSGVPVKETDLDLIYEYRNDFAVIQVNRRRATFDLAPEMREKLISEVNHGNGRIIVNLSYVEFIDSSFLGVLVAGLKLVKAHKGRIALVELHPHVQATLMLTHIDKIFPIYHSVEEAMRNLSAPPADKLV
jgi:anti-sigma B factor antagonist